MSRVKNKGIFVILILSFLSFFAFGCEKEVRVDDIYFTEENITLVVNETYSPKVVVQPSYADNVTYTITSTNTEYVSVENNLVKANKVTDNNAVYLQVTSNDNNLKTDLVRVYVIAETKVLETPRDLSYNAMDGTISFKSVENAKSYMLRVNGQDVNIGNVNTISLSDLSALLNKSVYDQELNIQVCAIANNNTGAYLNSEFSSSIFFYQTSAPKDVKITNGILSFSSNASKYVITLNDEEILTTSLTTVNLTDLNEKYAGLVGELCVKAVTEKTSSSVAYYDAKSSNIKVSVLGKANVSIQAGMLSWNNVTYADSYNVYLDAVLQANVKSNYISLSELKDYTNIANNSTDYSITIEPVLAQNSTNILKTKVKSNLVLVNKLADPTLTNEGGIVSWNAVENATQYILTLSYTLNEEEINQNLTISGTSFSIEDELFPANTEYSFTVKAINTKTSGTYYIDSNLSEIKVFKENDAEAYIEDYKLKIPSSILDKYSIIIDDNEEIVLTADNNTIEYDLSTIQFNAGKHTIYVRHLGDGTSSSSNQTQVEFTQLGQLDNLEIVDGVASGNLSTEYEALSFTIYSNESEVYSTEGENCLINSTDSTLEGYLASGDYTLSAFALGDGANTFTSKEISTITFKVLATPSFNIVEKDSTNISFANVDNASKYLLTVDDEEILLDTNNYTFVINAGQTINFKVQAIGNNGNVLDSAPSKSYSVMKLNTPALSFDNATDVISKTDNNSSDLILNYSFAQAVNGMLKPVLDYDFASTYEYFEAGTNSFALMLIARDVDIDNNISYLNSDSTSITVDVISGETAISTNAENKIVITSQDNTEHKFIMNITSGDYKLSLNGADGVLADEGGLISLPYTFDNGVYYVDILNEDYSSKIDELTNEFSVQVKFLADNENMADSTLSDSKNILFESATTFNQANFDERHIAFNNLAKGYQDYALLINDKYTLNLLSDAVISDADAGVIKVDVKYIYENLTEETSEILDIAVVSLNTSTSEANPTLAKAGEKIKIARNQVVELTGSKVNNSINNSIVLSFNLFDSTYEKSYVVEIYNKNNGEMTNVQTFNFTDAQDTDLDGIISFNLDDCLSNTQGETLDKNIFVRLYVRSNAIDYVLDEQVYIFNSDYSSELEYIVLDSVSNILIQNGEITFDAVENAVGYDIYRYEGASLIKINQNLIIDTHYSLADLSGNMSIVIRAIANEDMQYTNSYLTNVVKINKLNIQSLAVENGNIAINLDSATLALISNTGFGVEGDLSTFNGVIVRVQNGESTYYFSTTSKGVSLTETKFIIESDSLLTYGINNLQLESLTITLVTNYIETEDIYYLNSSSKDISVYGLLNPTSVTKISDLDNEKLEYIIWNNNPYNNMYIGDVNVDLTAGYILRVCVGDIIYYSTDSNLKYLDGDNYLSYEQLISNTKIPAPVGYDMDGDGSIGDSERFVAGEYKFAVKAVPVKLENSYNFASSAFSDELTVNIMSAPSPTTVNGVISWNEDNNATSYEISIFEKTANVNEDTPIASFVSTSPNFDFSAQTFDDYAGIYAIKVQAISTLNNVLNSQISDAIYVLRLNQAVSVEVDDGNLILEANDYFSSAEIEFVDKINGRKEYLYFDHEDALNENINNLIVGGESSWSDYIDQESNFLSATKFLIKIKDSNILNITQGRSYTINVKLFGNNDSSFGIVNSIVAKDISTINVVKLSQTASNVELIEVKKGVFKFNYLETYENINFNYNFNNSTDVSPFFEQTKIYLISLSSSQRTHNIYAIDYNSFINFSSLLNEEEYQIFEAQDNLSGLYAYVKFNYSRADGASGSLYFNVFENNEINLRDYDNLYYYEITTEEKESEIVYSSSGERTVIDVASGGSFVISLRLLGGDSIIEMNGEAVSSHIAYLNSSDIETDTFVRYSDNNLSGYNGYVQFTDLIPENSDGEIIDYPIYKLTITPLNAVDSKTVYIYYTSEEEARQVVNDDSAIYVQAMYEETLPDAVLFDMSKYFEPNTYQVNIRTLAGLGNNGTNADYLLNSREPITTTVFKKITDTTFSANSGVLNFDLAYVYDDNVIKYIYDYEITLSNGQSEYVYEINDRSLGVTVDNINHVVTYELPEYINIGEEQILIDNSGNYSIKIRALAKESQDRINGSYSKSGNEDITLAFTRSSGVENVRIEDGVLKFNVVDLSNFNRARIKVSYLDATNNECEVLISTNANAYYEQGVYQYHYYEFTYAVGSSYPIQGGLGNMQLDYGVEYNIQVQVLGANAQTAILNSNYSEALVATRLERVDSDNIISNAGILSWNEIAGAVEYVVTLEGIETYIFNTSTTSIDFETTTDSQGRYLASGGYTITIRALGNEILNSRDSIETEEFTRLSTVQNIRINSSDFNTIAWDEVLGADRYEVVFIYGENEPISQYVKGTTCPAPSGMSGAFTIKVRALGQESNKTLNGTFGTFISSTDQPQPVGAVQWNSKDYYYYFATADDFSSGDRILIIYDFTPYVKTNSGYELSSTSEQIQTYITFANLDSQIVIDGITYYYFQPTKMGRYENVSVQIERVGSLYSSASRGDDLDFNIFAYGDGTSENPYGVGTDSHLLNIGIKPNAYFELYNSVSLQSVNINDRVKEYGAIICDEFSGTINGNGFAIIQLNDINLDSSNTFGLFKSLSNANIYDLMIGAQDSSINVINSFANMSSQVIQLGMIASYSNNSTIENVTIYNLNITINSTTTLSGSQIYIGGLVGQSLNSEISGGNITTNIVFNAPISATTTTYIAGAIGDAQTTNISSINVDFGFTQNVTNNLFTYIGGLVGYINGDTAQNNRVEDATTDVNLTNVYSVYFGGIAGSARNVDILGCETRGEFAHANLSGTKYIGGLLGMGTSVQITDSRVYVMIDANIANTNRLYIGAIAGYLNTINSKPCGYDNCSVGYAFYNGQTYYDGNTLILGVYGYRSSDVSTGTCNEI